MAGDGTRPLGILLPKGGTADPLDRRPIWLMPMLYRVWAARRSRDWKRWRHSWYGDTQDVGAEEAAWHTARYIEDESAAGKEVGSIAFDWKKAYDGICLGLLAEACTRAGVPTWALSPLLDMYRRDRRIKVGNIIGENGTRGGESRRDAP